MDDTGIIVFIVGGILFTTFIFMLLFASKFRRVGPNEALIVSGRRHVVGGRTIGFRIVKGGGTFVWPNLERADVLSLEVRTAKLKLEAVRTVDGVPLDLEVSLQHRIGGHEDSIIAAAERFLSSPPVAIEQAVVQSVEGALRGRIGTLKAEEAWKSAAKLAEDALESTGADLRALGLEIVSLKVDSIKDKDGYLQLVGEMAVAEIKKNAEIAKAKMEEEMARVTAEFEKQAAQARAAVQEVLKKSPTRPCPQCRADNQPHFKFCSSCGKPLS